MEKRKVAIIKLNRIHEDIECSYLVSNNITDWTEVTDEDYLLLLDGIQQKNNTVGYNSFMYMLIEQPKQETTILELIEIGKDFHKKMEQQRIEFELMQNDRKNKAKQNKQKQLDKLAAELGLRVIKE